MKPSISVTPPEIDHFSSAKVTALLLLLLDGAVLGTFFSYRVADKLPHTSGIDDALWTVGLVLWFVSIVLAYVGVFTMNTMLFTPVYIVWTVTFVLSIVTILLDVCANLFCTEVNELNTNDVKWPCSIFLSRQGSLSTCLLLLLLKHVQLFHIRSLAIAMEKRTEDGSIGIPKAELFYTTRHPSWLRSKLSVSYPRKEESDDDDMVVFEKIAGSSKGAIPKVNDMGQPTA
ncbi:hypothetical protein KIN20_030377 [Parelaphostrongylus tenuis]|uniref:Uncharacterized protein n=1 Tax=Parelaphostrongylus tenuis TaxID=148309 RepID=A0AAD5WGF0_PARTN|nr:hypothetical protein KIN20_030377 [Parelaphostrongylus tenuis]